MCKELLTGRNPTVARATAGQFTLDTLHLRGTLWQVPVGSGDGEVCLASPVSRVTIVIVSVSHVIIVIVSVSLYRLHLYLLPPTPSPPPPLSSSLFSVCLFSIFALPLPVFLLSRPPSSSSLSPVYLRTSQEIQQIHVHKPSQQQARESKAVLGSPLLFYNCRTTNSTENYKRRS